MKLQNIKMKGSKTLLSFLIEGIQVTETQIEFAEFPMYIPYGESIDGEGNRYAVVPGTVIPLERDTEFTGEFIVYFKVGSGVIAQSKFIDDTTVKFDIPINQDGAILISGVIPAQASGGEIMIDIIEVTNE